MKNKVVALESFKSGGQVVIRDSQGLETKSNNIDELLSSLVAPYPDTFKVVWNMEIFLQPILELLPKELSSELLNGNRIKHGEFKVFLGFGKGAVLGVDWIVREHSHGNIFNESRYEDNIYELKLYYPNEKPVDINDIRNRGQFLVDTLHGMGFYPTKLTSPAAIYEECVLRDMNLYNIWDMPEESIEMAEWAANCCREWRSVYKLGYWETAYDVDLSCAYGSVLTKVPYFRNAKFIKTDGRIPKGAYWGIFKGDIDIQSEISHIVGIDDKCYRGKRDEIITTTDLAILNKWNIGTFKPRECWFVVFNKLDYVFDKPMRDIYNLRGSGNELQDRIAKNINASTWGRFIQRYGERLGDYYFPPIASMVTSKIRCMVADFIYSHGLQDSLISVTVDGLLSEKDSGITSEKVFGEWRSNPESQALVLSSLYQWVNDKRPGNVDVKKMVEDIKEHPMKKAWNGIALRFLEHDRVFEQLPKNGNDILNNIYESHLA